MFIATTHNNHLIHLISMLILGIAIFTGNLVTSNAAEKISKRALKEMIAGAKTAADHKAIADYYYLEATKARNKADEHVEMAASYKKAGIGNTVKIPYSPGTIEHCERLVKNYRASADDLTALAKEHEAMAAKAK